MVTDVKMTQILELEERILNSYANYTQRCKGKYACNELADRKSWQGNYDKRTKWKF